MKSLPVLAASVSVLFSACGGSTLGSVCRRNADVSCQKLYECTPDVAAQGGYTSVSDCVTKRQATCAEFDNVSCTGIDNGVVDQCLDDLRKAACAAGFPESCKTLQSQSVTSTCTSSDGRVMCTSNSASASTGACSTTRSGCGDGKAYAVTCTGSACVCTINDQQTKTYTGTCGSTAELNTNCGFNLR
jgi:hypothetical protein